MRTIILAIAAIFVGGCGTYEIPRGTSANPEIRDLQTRIAVLEHRHGITVKQPPRELTDKELIEEIRKRGIPAEAVD